MKQKNIIIITGASSGMGKEFVKQTDAKFPHVDEIWVIARRKEVLQEIADSCKHVCRVISCDLSNKADLNDIKQMLTKENPKISLLVNSAGYGILGEFYNTSSQIQKDNSGEEWMLNQTGMISLNCEALTAMTYLCIPYMRREGRIIQLASSAAFLPQPKFAVYAATKSYVLSFSRALNEELKKRSIYVTAVCPGPVDTEFFERAETGADTLFIKKFIMAKPDKVVSKALMDAKYKKEISVYGCIMKMFFFVAKILPHKFMLLCMRCMK